MEKLFNVIPSGFFNCLASGGNQEIYSDCLLLIYEQYEREISYRIARGRIRDAVAAYLLENHVRALEGEEENGVQKTYNDLANAVIRRFCSREVGWLEEDQDDATYEKHIVMTEQGILLAEFLQQLCQPEREEFSSYIYNIYNVLRSQEQWAENPYVNCLKNVYRNAKLLSKSLKRLSTFIKKIIERMVQEESLESLTENIIEYCEGDFIREYARLTKQQNIHIYRSFIRARLENMQNDAGLYEQLVSGCQAEEETDHTVLITDFPIYVNQIKPGKQRQDAGHRAFVDLIPDPVLFQLEPQVCDRDQIGAGQASGAQPVGIQRPEAAEHQTLPLFQLKMADLYPAAFSRVPAVLQHHHAVFPVDHNIKADIAEILGKGVRLFGNEIISLFVFLILVPDDKGLLQQTAAGPLEQIFFR